MLTCKREDHDFKLDFPLAGHDEVKEILYKTIISNDAGSVKESSYKSHVIGGRAIVLAGPPGINII